MNDAEFFKRLSRMGVFFLIGYGAFLLVCALIGNRLLLIIGSLSIVGAFLILLFQPRMRQHVQRRQEMREAAVAGDTSLAPLASPQPVPDEYGLPLPCIIKLRPKVSMMSVSAAAFTVFWALLLLTVGLFTQGADGLFTTFTSSIGGTLFILVLFPFLLIFIVALFTTSQQIEVTQKGLTIRQATNKSAVRWDEVKLFATQSRRKRAPTIFYQLSTDASMLSSGVIVQRLQRGARLQFFKPITSFDEYDRQMEALLSLIAARTGLPLYDLR